MPSDRQNLAKDTLSFLKQEGLLDRKKDLSFSSTSFSTSPSPLPPTPLPSGQLKQGKTLHTSLSPTPHEKMLEEKRSARTSKNSLLLFAPIKKHLPHIQLIDAIPPMDKVAIIAENEEDLSFLQTLARAIEKHFCPVKILKEPPKKEGLFTLILSQKPVAFGQQIPLATIASYENNIEKKKELWSSICQILSHRSS